MIIEILGLNQVYELSYSAPPIPVEVPSCLSPVGIHHARHAKFSEDVYIAGAKGGRSGL